MEFTITSNKDGTSTVAVDFNDEDVEFRGTTTVKGGEQEALQYLPTFEKDLRCNFADRFPVVETEAEEEME